MTLHYATRLVSSILLLGALTGAGPCSSDAEVGGDGPDGGGGDIGADLIGFYQVTSHSFDDTGCAGPGEAITDGQPPLFEVYQDQVGGFPFLFVHSCEGFDNCEGGGSDFFVASLMRPGAGGVYAGSAFASIDASPCKLLEIQSEMTPTADGVHLVMRRRELEAPDLAGDTCAPSAGQDRAADMVCVNQRTVDGVKQ